MIGIDFFRDVVIQLDDVRDRTARGFGGSAQVLEDLLDTVTDAQEVLGIIRAEHPGCVNIANSNILVVQEN